ncbi:hypothetical protein BC629DRAFT_1496924 [Irpex lacteus]|nr:hypothetical protein BC629DRAFT_1496924 [Irpex lacteus]
MYSRRPITVAMTGTPARIALVVAVLGGLSIQTPSLNPLLANIRLKSSAEGLWSLHSPSGRAVFGGIVMTVSNVCDNMKPS